ncbi:TIGR03826 family flagellar region protein [Salipaludibacillus aurantiacus]|uniref:Flagellar operon protein TIGR03826 n=1 Tax=Salipaludibacillus aurantiacus TaxID=1601833 RepID=A0A1H9W8J7_9BACI|nr:TIGR03826 family flagellar region protein [Salipaludibacillus aurantiacus]SES30286.1 flagellar operon protein TIGR03826 [Salipaludibacillus aurantiacus]
MAELANCPNCGKVFAKALRPTCDACAQQVEEKFERVYKFIRKRENRQATMDEVTEATDVEKALVYQFIREGRLQLAQFPNLGYPCEKCGVQIRQNRLCSTCTDEINKGIRTKDRQKAFEQRMKNRENPRAGIYTTLDDRVRRNR